MGRAPCCDKASVKKGPWSPEEDARLKSYIEQHGTGGNWIALPQKIGLKRCGKSCRLRWLNYLRPNIKHGGFSEEEDRIILGLYITIGSRWSIIAAQLPGRTDNDIKNYWNTRLKKKLFGKQSRKDLRRGAAAAGQKPEAAGGQAAGGNGGAAVWWGNQQGVAVAAAHPAAGLMEHGRAGDDVDESIRKLLLKLGGGPFFTAPSPACAPPPMYEEAPVSLVAPSVHAASLGDCSVQCAGALPPPVLELDESFQFSQVKLDGLDGFFGMAMAAGTDEGRYMMKWGDGLSPLACPSMVSSSHSMQQYSILEEAVDLGMQMQ